MVIITAKTIASPICALVLSPLLFGIINRIKALFAGRHGQPLFQVYHDLFKLFKKSIVYSTTITPLFWLGPIFYFSTIVICTFFTALPGTTAIISFPGDPIALIFLFGFGRFFMILASIDTGSAFEGMGASRDAFFSFLIEPILLVVFFSLAYNIDDFSIHQFQHSFKFHNPVVLICIGISFFILLLAENYRIPFDDPNTHLELTMIHEVMVLDHSGPDLGFITYGNCLKLYLFIHILVSIIFPHPETTNFINTTLVFLSFFGIAALIGIIESVMARNRLLSIPQILSGAFSIAVIGFVLGSTLHV